MKAIVTLGAAALAVAVAGTAAHAQTQAPATDTVAGPTRPAARPRRNLNLLTAEEIAAAHASTAYDAVSRLRSRWLRDRPGSEQENTGDPVTIKVYRNGQIAGDVNALREIAADNVGSIEWVGPMVARTRFGPHASHGAIVVTDKH